MLYDILDDDHIQWHPPLIGHYTNFWPLLIWTLLPNLTFYLNIQGFHRTYATGAACQQRTLTPPDAWSCPTLGLACVLMLRPISPELVLSPDFWISNTPRYFSFAYAYKCEEVYENVRNSVHPTAKKKWRTIYNFPQSNILFFVVYFYVKYTVRKQLSTTRQCRIILMFKIIYQNKFIIWHWGSARFDVNHPFLSSGV